MNRELTLDETIEVERPLNEVFAYVAEFSRIEEWDPAVLHGTRLSEGAPGLGSEYRIDMKAGFSQGKKSRSVARAKSRAYAMSRSSISRRRWLWFHDCFLR